MSAIGRNYFRTGDLEKTKTFLYALENEFFDQLGEYELMTLGHLYLCVNDKQNATAHYRNSYKRFEDKDEFLDEFEDDFKYIQVYGIEYTAYRQLKMELSLSK